MVVIVFRSRLREGADLSLRNHFNHTFAMRDGDTGTKIENRPVDVVYVEKDGQKVPKYPLEVRKY